MIPFIFLFIAAFTILSCLTAVFLAEKRARQEREEHERNVASPYRIVLSGMCEYRIQRYEYLRQSQVQKEETIWETPKSDWQWVAIGDQYDDLEEAKKKYCALMAAFRKKTGAETETFIKNWADVSKNRIHTDGRDQVVELDGCDEIIAKMMEEPKKTRKRKKDGEGTAEASVAE
jgi:hypothetical protein